MSQWCEGKMTKPGCPLEKPRVGTRGYAMAPESGGGRRLAPQALVLEGNHARAVPALQAPHDEMPAGQRLEMVGEGRIDRRAADRAQDRCRLGGELLAHHDAEARGDLRNQPRDDRRGLGADALGGDKARAVADRFGERGADGEIAALEAPPPRPPGRRGRTLRRRRMRRRGRSNPRPPRARFRRSSAEGWSSRSAVRSAAPPTRARLRRRRTPQRQAYEHDSRAWPAL